MFVAPPVDFVNTSHRDDEALNLEWPVGLCTSRNPSRSVNAEQATSSSIRGARAWCSESGAVFGVGERSVLRGDADDNFAFTMVR